MKQLMSLGLLGLCAAMIAMPSFSIDDEPQSGGDSGGAGATPVDQTLGNTEGNPLDETAGEGANEAAEQNDDSDQGDDGSDGDESNDEPDGFEDDGA